MKTRPGTWDGVIVEAVHHWNEYMLPDRMDGWAVIDIGAHIGAFAVECAERGASVVFAYEPEPSNFELLEENTKPFDVISAFNFAVLDRNTSEIGLRYLTNHDQGRENTGHRDIFGESDSSRPWGMLQAISIDQVFRAFGGKVDLLKIDTEGSEWFILDALDFDMVDRIVAELHEPPRGEHPLLKDLEGSNMAGLSERLQDRLQEAGFAVEILETSPETALLRATRLTLLPKSDDVPLDPEAPFPCLCGRLDAKTFMEVDGKDIVQCLCGIVRVGKIDLESYTAQYMSGFYQADYKNTEVDAEYTKRFEHDKNIAHMRIVELEKVMMPPSGGKLLDIGCANGAFVEAALDCGYDAWGIDLSGASFHGQGAVDERLQVAPIADCGHRRRTLDIVTMLDVIEHIPDPKRALRQVNGMLKRDGILVLETPNFIDMERDRKHVKPTEHLWYLTPKQWTELLSACDFVICDFKYPINGKIVFYCQPNPQTVLDVKVEGPTGIGDVYWVLQKLWGLKKAESPCRLTFSVVGPPPPHADPDKIFRSKGLLRLLPWINNLSFDFGELVMIDSGAEDVAVPYYRMIANQHLESGKSIKDWYPEFETRYDFPVYVPVASREFAQGLRAQHRKLVLIYTSSDEWNETVSSKKNWGVRHWNDVIAALNEADISPVLIGKGWDANFGSKIRGKFVNMLGRTSEAQICAMYQVCDAVVGMCSGITIIAPHMKAKSIVFWPLHTPMLGTHIDWRSFAVDWVPPDMADKYKALFVGEFDVDDVLDQFKEWEIL